MHTCVCNRAPRQAVAVLQCLQRLAVSHDMAGNPTLKWTLLPKAAALAQCRLRLQCWVVTHIEPLEQPPFFMYINPVPRCLAFPCCAESLLQVPGAIGRLFAAYSCGSDPVVCETARLLLRLWAPAAARAGAGRLEATSACSLLTLVVLSGRDHNPAVGGAVLC